MQDFKEWSQTKQTAAYAGEIVKRRFRKRVAQRFLEEARESFERASMFTHDWDREDSDMD